MTTNNKKTILVIGGGIAGMSAALDAAEVGCPVILVEKDASLGGRVLRTHRYFPKMCPPACGFEINIGRIKRNPRISVYTLAEVKEITGEVGAFRVRIRIEPRYVTEKVSIDDSLTESVTSLRPDDFNAGMCQTKALYLPHARCYPPRYVLDRNALSNDDAALLERSCPSGAIDFRMQAKEFYVEAAAIIVATGWQPYDAKQLSKLGFGLLKNVITNAMMERLAAQDGPTKGDIQRPGDKKSPSSVAFVQCAGSRDDDNLPYCSAVCCMAALKQARYLLEQNADTQITIFYIDIRTLGRLEKFYLELLETGKVSFVKGKVAEINETPDGEGLSLLVEDTLKGERLSPVFDMVVLSTGIVPNRTSFEDTFAPQRDAYGFLIDEALKPGIFAAGCAKQPCDVSRTVKDAASAALKAVQCVQNRDVR